MCHITFHNSSYATLIAWTCGLQYAAAAGAILGLLSLSICWMWKDSRHPWQPSFGLSVVMLVSVANGNRFLPLRS